MRTQNSKPIVALAFTFPRVELGQLREADSGFVQNLPRDSQADQSKSIVLFSFRESKN